MGRIAEGWRIRRPKGRTVYVVRFTHNGRTVDRSTGATHPEQASRAAARIYADFVQREPAKRPVVRRGDAPPFEELVVTWLSTDSTIDEDTADVWTVYGGHWAQHWETIGDISEASCEDYRNRRLRVVLATTVRKELSALRRFLAWCRTLGYLRRDVQVCGVPEKTTGKRFGKRRRVSAGELTPEQIRKLLAELPDWSSSRRVERFPIRARFVVGYETGLRPGTLDALSVPEHFRPGAQELNLTDDVDKIRWGRVVPLSVAAQSELERVAPAAGLIFGSHDYREHIREAAQAALPAHLASRFCAAHLRSARITHLLEESGNLQGVQYIVGHKQSRTTGLYARPSLRAAEDVLRPKAKRGRSRNIGDARPKKNR